MKDKYTFTATQSDFFSKSTRCSGILYTPDGLKNPPIVVMGHGFACEKSFGIPAFAERFAQKGMAVFFFDYRNFGDSEGEPRNYVNPIRHNQDWHAALAHVRSLPNLNNNKIAIWGSSFGGGHVISVASRDHDIAAVVSQVPFVDGISSFSKIHPIDIAKAIGAGIRDCFRMITMRDPYYSPVIGKPGTFAAMNSEESWPGYSAIIPKESKWENKVASRVFLMIPFYSPLLMANKVQAPTLIVAAEEDSLVPVRTVKWTAKRIKNCELAVLDCNHFAPYRGVYFEKNIKLETDFLTKHLFA